MKKLPYIVSVIVLGFMFSCGKKATIQEERDFPQMVADGEITAITLSGSISYFIYKGEEMGYEYELLKSFADAHNLKLTIKIAENVTKLTEMLRAGEGDLIAYNIPITNEDKKNLIYCGREVINEQVLVQRSEKGSTLLKDVTEMIGKEVWVVSGSKYDNRLINLNHELGGGILISKIEKDTISVEDMIDLVSDGTIPYTVSDRNIAQLNKTYHSNIHINLKISHPQRSSWAVANSSPQLAQTLNEWFKKNRNNPRYKAIMKRYFEMSKVSENETFIKLSNGKISPYDHLFEKYAPQINWDWRLLASIAYQESKFDTTAVSWAGAGGLMGLMPRTAEAFGLSANQITNPEGSIRTAVNYLKSLNKSFSSFENNEEKIKFILASYNAGPGHIYDAQALAEKYGKSPSVWEDNVEEYLKLKSLPEYYNDEVCKQGYFRSSETVNYVKRVLKRWAYYQEKIKTTNQ